MPSTASRGEGRRTVLAGERGDDLQPDAGAAPRLARQAVRSDSRRPQGRNTRRQHALDDHTSAELARGPPDRVLPAPVNRQCATIRRRHALEPRARRGARPIRCAGQSSVSWLLDTRHRSDFRMLGPFQSIIYLYTKVAHCALQLRWVLFLHSQQLLGIPQSFFGLSVFPRFMKRFPVAAQFFDLIHIGC